LLLPTLALTWPQALLAAWPWSVTLALTASLASWALVVGGVVAIVCATRTSPGWLRLAAAAACVSLTLVMPARLFTRPPGASSLGPSPGWMLSPATAAYEIVRDRSWSGSAARVSWGHWRAIGLTAAGGGAVWSVACVVRIARREDAA
jgi:hypothetical protein